MKTNLTRKEKERFKIVNNIHPKEWTPLEEYDFYTLLGRQYLGNSTRKTKKYTQTQKKFYRDQGNYAILKANKIKKKHKL